MKRRLSLAALIGIAGTALVGLPASNAATFTDGLTSKHVNVTAENGEILQLPTVVSHLVDYEGYEIESAWFTADPALQTSLSEDNGTITAKVPEDAPNGKEYRVGVKAELVKSTMECNEVGDCSSSQIRVTADRFYAVKVVSKSYQTSSDLKTDTEAPENIVLTVVPLTGGAESKATAQEATPAVSATPKDDKASKQSMQEVSPASQWKRVSSEKITTLPAPKPSTTRTSEVLPVKTKKLPVEPVKKASQSTSKASESTTSEVKEIQRLKPVAITMTDTFMPLADIAAVSDSRAVEARGEANSHVSLGNVPEERTEPATTVPKHSKAKHKENREHQPENPQPVIDKETNKADEVIRQVEVAVGAILIFGSIISLAALAGLGFVGVRIYDRFRK